MLGNGHAGRGAVESDICGCALIKVQTHYNPLITLSQHALTTFQSGIISPSSTISLLCSTWSVRLHVCVRVALQPLHFFLSSLLFKSIFTLFSFTYCPWPFVFINTCGFGSKTCAYDRSCLRAHESTGIFYHVCMVFDKFGPVTVFLSIIFCVYVSVFVISLLPEISRYSFRIQATLFFFPSMF